MHIFEAIDIHELGGGQLLEPHNLKTVNIQTYNMSHCMDLGVCVTSVQQWFLQVYHQLPNYI